jgi:hypothetical protein
VSPGGARPTQIARHRALAQPETPGCRPRCGRRLSQHNRKTSRIWRIDSLLADIPSPSRQKRTRLPWVENCQRCSALHHLAGLITITGIGDQLRPEFVITFDRNTHEEAGLGTEVEIYPMNIVDRRAVEAVAGADIYSDAQR